MAIELQEIAKNEKAKVLPDEKQSTTKDYVQPTKTTWPEMRKELNDKLPLNKIELPYELRP